LHESIDWPLPAKPSGPSRPRRRGVFILIAIVAVLVFGTRTAVSYWVDLLWFRSLDYADVFWKARGIEWGIFAAFALVTFVYLYGVFSLLKRTHVADLPDDHTIIIAGNPISLPVVPALRIAAVCVSFLIALATAAAMQAQCPRWRFIGMRRKLHLDRRAALPTPSSAAHSTSIYLRFRHGN
jgi:uncharacterized protein